MAEQRRVSTSGGQPSIPELTARIEDQSIKDQPEGILEKSSKKPGKQSQQSKTKTLKQAQQGGEQGGKKQQGKKKIEGAALIGIDVAKEADFPEWYQQVLTKGDFLDYYDVSGCVSQDQTLVSARAKTMPPSVYPQAAVLLHLGGDTGLVQQKDQEHWRRKLRVPAICI